MRRAWNIYWFKAMILSLLIGITIHLVDVREDTANAASLHALTHSRSTISKYAGATPLVPAFPGAEGFGANSVGGRGGRVIEVTNLNDRGEGSLRAAIDAKGPRMVIFRTGGMIELKSGLVINDPYITIAGQTAPGGGITLKNADSNTKTPITITTHDVIIRYLRVRPGPGNERASTFDALQITGGYNIIIDHSSFSWATDEVLSTWYSPHDITIQWSIISEGLYHSSEHGIGGKGLLLGSEGAERISLHHNLLAHNSERNPRIKTSGIVDIVNNVIYNPKFTEEGWGPSHITDDYAKVPVNYIGNYFLPGSDSGPASYYISTSGAAAIFLDGNVVPHHVIRPEDQAWVVDARHHSPAVVTTSAQDAYEQVLAGVGATCPVRDVVDQRIVNDVIARTGRIIDDPLKVGGWPQVDPGTPPSDQDHDGMPDAWESQHGFNPDDPNDGSSDRDGNGYTNLEEYLNQCSWDSISFQLVATASSRDVEESSDSRRMNLKSSDLDLGSKDVGVRFTQVNIPSGATIANAYLQFQVDEESSRETSLKIEGGDIDDAPKFTSEQGTLSARERTTASVSWSPAPWTSVGEAGPNQRTPNISPIIQEIVDRPGWANGNSLTLFITGSGERVAKSYDGSPAQAPLLHVEYYAN